MSETTSMARLDGNICMIGHYLLTRDRASALHGRIVHVVQVPVCGVFNTIAVLAVVTLAKGPTGNDWVLSEDSEYIIYPWHLFSERKDVHHETHLVSGKDLMHTLVEIEDAFTAQ